MGGESGKVWFAELVLGGTFLRRFGKPITQSSPQVLVLRRRLSANLVIAVSEQQPTSYLKKEKKTLHSEY